MAINETFRFFRPCEYAKVVVVNLPNYHRQISHPLKYFNVKIKHSEDPLFKNIKKIFRNFDNLCSIFKVIQDQLTKNAAWNSSYHFFNLWIIPP